MSTGYWRSVEISGVPVGSRWRRDSNPERAGVVEQTDEAFVDGRLIVRFRYDSGTLRPFLADEFLSQFVSHVGGPFSTPREDFRKPEWGNRVATLGHLPYPNAYAVSPEEAAVLKATWKSIADKSLQRRPFANGAR